ncbi:MAG: hypothetical protein IPP71_10170 [Bacteroidetes bacterium]|nr:hypothetical protein [Bacteroidota bacterium]
MDLCLGFRDARGLGIKDKIRWYAGMVVQFAEDDELRNELQARLHETLASVKPDVIFAHSLGTLVVYDLLRQEAVNGISRNLTVVTSGSQIGHPALLMLFGGAIQPLNVNYWINLHNQNDKVFAYEPIGIEAENFSEIETPFSVDF